MYRQDRLISVAIRFRLPEQVEQVQAEPGEPGERPGDPQRRWASSTTADRRPIVAMVPLSWYWNGSVGSPRSRRTICAGDVPALLQRGLRELRRRVVLVERDVAGREDPVGALDPQVGPDEEAAVPCPAGSPQPATGSGAATPPVHTVRSLRCRTARRASSTWSGGHLADRSCSA